MVIDGADIIDIGGESSRPGAEPVSIEEELRRVIPIIEALAKRLRHQFQLIRTNRKWQKRHCKLEQRCSTTLPALKIQT